MLYLLKVTIIWAVLLLLFELLFRSNARYLANRIYLAASLLAGTLIPLIKMPYTLGSNTMVRSVNTVWNTGRTVTTVQASGGQPSGGMDWQQLLLFGYIAGAAFFLVLSLREIAIILRHAIYGSYQTVGGHKLFAINKQIAPHSFMGWIFVNATSGYDKGELDFILAHEAAHNRQKHWLDLLFVQAVCVLFWFHPLVWRFRYLLRLQHEYEADAIASGNDAYTYGHFLLQQTLLKGTPFVAHSFHFSPIKNRINMLTSNQTNRMQGWKYLMVLPALFACTILVAKNDRQHASRAKSGNQTTFNGNKFYWTKESAPDTVAVFDAVTKEETVVISRKDPVIVKMNEEPVTETEGISVPAQFRNGNKNFSEYMKDRLKERGVQIPESIVQIAVNRMVISKTGRLMYYELSFLVNDASQKPAILDYDSKLTPVLEEIIADSPDWMPASANGKPVNVFVAFDPSCTISSGTASKGAAPGR